MAQVTLTDALKRLSRIAAIGTSGAAILLCAGCALTPPVTAPTNFCGFAPQDLEVPQPPERIAPPSAEGAAGVAPAVLFLSGGSQNGAFGAGMLDQWKRNAGHLPRFRVVTGISTGAMLATAAFLDRPELAVDAYTIRNERELITPYVSMDNGNIGLLSLPALARHNAAADLEPLSRTLETRLIPFSVIEQVAAEAGRRRLLVGAVDVDSGKAVIFDLTDMAHKAVDAARAGHGEEADRYHHCYVQALIASSSVPLAAPPTFIDNRMYVDGGARYGVFAQEMTRSAGFPGDGGRPDAVDAVYVIVNGTQDTEPQCGKLIDPKHPLPPSEACAADGSDDFRHLAGAHRPWNLVGVGQRSVDILIDQVYHFSVAQIYDQVRDSVPPAELPDKWHYAYMDAARRDAFVPDEPAALRGRSCAAWKAVDVAEQHPLQFDPRYMQCIMAYGRRHAVELCWGLGATHSDDVGTTRRDPAAAAAPCAAPTAATGSR